MNEPFFETENLCENVKKSNWNSKKKKKRKMGTRQKKKMEWKKNQEWDEREYMNLMNEGMPNKTSTTTTTTTR